MDVRHRQRSHFAGPALSQLLQRSAQPTHLMTVPSAPQRKAHVLQTTPLDQISRQAVVNVIQPRSFPSRATQPERQILQSSVETHSAQNSPQSWQRPPRAEKSIGDIGACCRPWWRSGLMGSRRILCDLTFIFGPLHRRFLSQLQAPAATAPPRLSITSQTIVHLARLCFDALNWKLQLKWRSRLTGRTPQQSKLRCVCPSTDACAWSQR